MRLLIIYMLISSVGIGLHAQETTTESFAHEGKNRSYILYVPESYDEEIGAPLVLNFHGYTSNAYEQMWYGDFRALADEHGFIIAHPEGTLLDGSTHFNVGGWTTSSTTDDVAFTEEMINQIGTSYNIDQERIYSTGMSNGGYMSFLLACQLSDKIAAIASVTGSMTPETFDVCEPTHPTPIIQMHGTRDGVVPYGGASWTRSIDDVVDYWIGYNECDTNAVVDILPNLNTTDGSTIARSIYSNGNNDAEVIHFKVNGGGHTWPGTRIGANANLDIDASAVIWEFFSRYDINGLRDLTSNTKDTEPNLDLEVYPNPSSDYLIISNEELKNKRYQIYNAAGSLEHSDVIGSKKQISLSNYNPGVYFIKFEKGVAKFVISK